MTGPRKVEPFDAPYVIAVALASLIACFAIGVVVAAHIYEGVTRP